MKLMKAIFIMAITMGLSITLTVNRIGQVEEEKQPFLSDDGSTTFSSKAFEEPKPMPSKKLSRFLAEDQNPRAADHCHKDEEVCYLLGGKNYTCCNNKCFDLTTDNSNCGACKNKCHFTQACCRGQCVYLSLDKRHCGSCNNRCKKGEYCLYGMCSYSA